MLYGLSNILKRETRERRQESMTADQEGAGLDLDDEMARIGCDPSLVRFRLHISGSFRFADQQAHRFADQQAHRWFGGRWFISPSCSAGGGRMVGVGELEQFNGRAVFDDERDADAVGWAVRRNQDFAARKL
jgi:hypothetical protein